MDNFSKLMELQGELAILKAKYGKLLLSYKTLADGICQASEITRNAVKKAREDLS